MNPFSIAIIRHQLAVLDAYAAALVAYGGSETQMNGAMKTWMSMMLPTLQAQCALWDQMFAAHLEAIEGFRKQLREELHKHEGKHTPEARHGGGKK